MTAVWWIGGALLWLLVGTAVGRVFHLSDKRRPGHYDLDDGAMNLIVGLMWPTWVALGIVLSPFIGAYLIMTLPSRKDRQAFVLRKQLERSEQDRLATAAWIKRLEHENKEIDAVLAKIQKKDLR